MFDSIFDGLVQKVTDLFGNFFNTEFWGLVGYTGIATVAAFALGYFFPQLRALCGTVLVGIAGVWYGFHKGQKSRGD